MDLSLEEIYGQQMEIPKEKKKLKPIKGLKERLEENKRKREVDQRENKKRKSRDRYMKRKSKERVSEDLGRSVETEEMKEAEDQGIEKLIKEREEQISSGDIIRPSESNNDKEVNINTLLEMFFMKLNNEYNQYIISL